MSKLEEIIALIEKAGFTLVGEGIGCGDLDGLPSKLYEKRLSHNKTLNSHRIQLSTAISETGREDIFVSNTPDFPPLLLTQIREIRCRVDFDSSPSCP
jgi:hypothetical protein